MSYHSFDYQTLPFVANFEERFPKLAIFPDNPYEPLAEGTKVILTEAIAVVYASEKPIVIDSTAIDETHIVKTKRFMFSFGKTTINMVFVTAEERPKEFGFHEFVTLHPNVTHALFYIGDYSKVKHFFAKLLIRVDRIYPKGLKNIPCGYIRESFIDRIMVARDNIEFFKLMVANGNCVDRQRELVLNDRAKFLIDLTNINCYGHERKVQAAIESLIHSLMHIKNNTEEDITGRLDYVLALNVLTHTDILKTSHTGLLQLTEYGSFVVDLFELK